MNHSTKINEFRIAFVGGIHGVGKSLFSSRASEILKIPRLSASELITQQRKAPAAINKRVQDVRENQDALISAIESHPINGRKFILDGHFCVFDSLDVIHKISIGTFRELAPVAVVVLLDEINRIQERLCVRDKRDIPLDVLNRLQISECDHAEMVCDNLKIPMCLAQPSKHETALQFMADHINQQIQGL
jgi:adenylate kinase